ncbi:MAG TPA: YggS family pyridoxal phosphate-dependent enzyme [Limnobacter sp.]|uniref:YggS family pyridoxal phosphate-dependent enzyme n=1 Tax=Limnobacter sp. TaxID=2003368 RepID=UPI002ED8C6D7
MNSAQERLTSIQQRIRAACQRSGRDVQSVQLLAVSKTFPAESVLDMATLGQTAFGENYLQEALDKITHLAELPACKALQWHFIGPIQSNKTRPIAEHFDWVHSVDRLKIAQRLSEQRPAHLPPLNVLVQINTSGEDSKSGVNPADAVALCQAVASLPNLRLRGLMTIPSPTENTEQLRGEFNICRTTFNALNEAGLSLDTLSMGMSADLELAIECGSTCVRVGTALFGARH